MKTYYIYYTTKSGDHAKVWVNANSKEDAERQAKQEYWDIERIDCITAR